MSALTAASRGRAKAEQIMTDTCVITHITGWTLNPATGVNTPTTVTLYTGKCRAKVAGRGADASAGETVVPKIPVVVSIPTSVTNVIESAHVDMVTSNDPDLVGKVLLIKAVQSSTHITARRLLCEEMADA